jgi:hypothetical protein
VKGVAEASDKILEKPDPFVVMKFPTNKMQAKQEENRF